MAGLKKKKKEKSGSPNTVLVVFLVLFVLVSIGLGVWGYYGYAGQEDLRTKAKNADAAAKSEKTSAVYYAMLWRDLRSAIGPALDADELQQLDLDRDEFLKGSFKAEKYGDVAKKLMEDNRALLGSGDGKHYDKTFTTELKIVNDKVFQLTGERDNALKKNTRTEKVVADAIKKQDDFHQTANQSITAGNTAAIAEAKKRSDAFLKLEADLKEQTAKNGENEQKNRDQAEEFDKLIKRKEREITNLTAQLNENRADGARGIANAPRGDHAPLIVDVSTGKPLWDSPVGKIVRVEPDLRTVTINLGLAQGAKPELTFNIFSANSAGRAIGQLKGSVEIIKVIDTSTSVARITSLYDAEGREISLSDPVRSRIRETESPIKEGDLLFNMFWGARVAITGYVSLTGDGTDNPAEQIRQTEDFMYLLTRMGMQVDAFVDLRDGQVRGKITNKTRYLIRGDDFRAEAPKAAAAPAEGDEDKKPAAKEAANADRNELINKANMMLRRDAVEKGLLLISAENFATVIGYRKSHNANDASATLSRTRFEPRLPYSGTNVGAGVNAPAQKQGDDEKKAPEPKEKDAGN